MRRGLKDQGSRFHMSGWCQSLTGILLLAVALMSVIWVAPAAQGQPPPIIVETRWQPTTEGGRITLAVSIPPGLHINADADQVTVMDDFEPVATRVSVSALPAGVTAGPVIYPPAHGVAVSFANEPLMVFDGSIQIHVPLSGDGLLPGSIPAVRLELRFQACDETVCYFPETREFTIGADFALSGQAPDIQRPETAVGFHFFGLRVSLDTAGWFGRLMLMAMAALGGVFLNLTPCVLPLIPIKIISLSSAADQNPRRCFLLGAAMAAGIVAFWGALGILVFTISGLTAANQLFQYPWFTVSVGLVIAVMALGMLRPAAVTLPGWVYMINPSQERMTGSFLLGILAAVLSTPCTAPFMGAAVAWAVTQPPGKALAVFLAVGVGMALPYVVLAARPTLARRLPKTGPANQLLKEVMGWLMLAAAAYFTGTGISGLLAAPAEPPSRAYWWVVMGCCGVAALWFAFKYRRMAATPTRGRVGMALGWFAAGAAALMGAALSDTGEIAWVHYTPERYAEVMSLQKPVVLVFTAEWCLNCKAIEQQVYRNPEVVRLFSNGEAVPMKIDLTAPDSAGRSLLQSTGRLTIPLVVVRAPDGHDTLVADFYTAGDLIDAVRKAAPTI